LSSGREDQIGSTIALDTGSFKMGDGL